MAQAVRFPEVEVQLVGTDGNVFALIGTVSRELKRAGYKAEAREFVSEATSQGSYDAVLQLILRTVTVC